MPLIQADARPLDPLAPLFATASPDLLALMAAGMAEAMANPANANRFRPVEGSR